MAFEKACTKFNNFDWPDGAFGSDAASCQNPWTNILEMNTCVCSVPTGC